MRAQGFDPFPKLREWLHPIEHREYVQSRAVLNGVVDRVVSAARERLAARKAEEKEEKPVAGATSQEAEEGLCELGKHHAFVARSPHIHIPQR